MESFSGFQFQDSFPGTFFRILFQDSLPGFFAAGIESSTLDPVM